MRGLSQAAFLLLSGSLSQAQTPQPPAFDVASVKPQKFTGEGTVGFSIEGTRLRAEHVKLNQLIVFAYNIGDFQLSGGPSRAASGALFDSELFEVIAKSADGQTPSMDQFRLMVQTLLAERFHLQIYHVSKQLPAYNPVVKVVRL